MGENSIDNKLRAYDRFLTIQIAEKKKSLRRHEKDDPTSYMLQHQITAFEISQEAFRKRFLDIKQNPAFYEKVGNALWERREYKGFSQRHTITTIPLKKAVEILACYFVRNPFVRKDVTEFIRKREGDDKNSLFSYFSSGNPFSDMYNRGVLERRQTGQYPARYSYRFTEETLRNLEIPLL